MHLLAKLLLAWYQIYKRNLPWRNTRDPYHIWLSEIILQQTRVIQGMPYYQKFVQSFSTVHDLAHAREDTVLRMWQGLGYYTRARNLHKCARIVSEQFNGNFPTDYNELLKLPGIGRYTAAAIASIANDARIPVIDGNVFRVITRVYGIGDDIARSSTYTKIHAILSDIIPDQSPGEFNQALMELGATICSPNNPDCFSCALREMCYARINNQQNKFPVKKRSARIKIRYFNYLVIFNNNKVLMKKRDTDDIWKGLYDFPLIESYTAQPPVQFGRKLSRSINPAFRIDKISNEYVHILSHQQIRACFFETTVENKIELTTFGKNCKWILLEKVHSIPKPILIHKFLIDHRFI